MIIKAIIHEAKEGGYWAEVPALPGCISEGDNLEELKSNLKEAITGWLEVYNEEPKKVKNLKVGYDIIKVV